MRPGTFVLLVAVTVGLVIWLTTIAPDGNSRPLRVLVASSLSEVASDLVDAWTETLSSEQTVSVELIAGGSNHLVAQLRDGAPADAFLTADPDLFDDLTAAGVALGRQETGLAHNHLVVAQPAHSPTRSPIDLRDPSLVLVACAPEVPCGVATLARFGDLPVDSFEASARAVVTRLALDEADLGVAYATDVSSHPDLVPAWPQEPTCPCVSYAAVALSPVGTPFVAFLADDRARSILTTHGFPVEPPR
jgi:molybdate transport system substrate-binding protein